MQALRPTVSLTKPEFSIGALSFKAKCSYTPIAQRRPFQYQIQQRRNISISQLESAKDNRERVIILGSGWAGYNVARNLDPRKFQTVVVSPRSYFVFTPLLASTSVGTLEFRTALEPIRSKRNRISFFQGWADAVDFKNRVVTIEEGVNNPDQALAPTSDRSTEADANWSRAKDYKKGQLFSLKYDKLIVSVGCYSQTFDTPGVRENALFLKDVGDARKIRKRLLACFEAAALPTSTDEIKKCLLNFAVVGGGPTGFEFAAELHDIIREDLAKLYPDLMQFYAITVYDVSPEVLPMFDRKLGQYAIDTFRRKGIEIKTRHHVESLRPGMPSRLSVLPGSDSSHPFLTLSIKEEGEVGAGMVVWSTGLMKNPFVQHALGRKIDMSSESAEMQISGNRQLRNSQWLVKSHPKSGSIVVNDRLQVKLLSTTTDKSEAIMHNVYALGDCAAIEKAEYPATAQVANQQAVWLAKRLNKEDLEENHFTWKNLGIMAYVGNWNAIFQSSGKELSGRAAWFLWRGAYLTKSVSWRNRILIPMYWLLNWMFGRDISRF